MWIVHDRFTAGLELIGSEFVEVQDNDTGILFERILVTATVELSRGCESKQSFLGFLV